MYVPAPWAVLAVPSQLSEEACRGIGKVEGQATSLIKGLEQILYKE